MHKFDEVGGFFFALGKIVTKSNDKIICFGYSLDRLLLAILWTSYMFIAWTTDKADVEYHKGQLFRKQNELNKSQ